MLEEAKLTGVYSLNPQAVSDAVRGASGGRLSRPFLPGGRAGTAGTCKNAESTGVAASVDDRCLRRYCAVCGITTKRPASFVFDQIGTRLFSRPLSVA